MRWCLTCRHLSADGPLCTHCGRSFGGRLCDHKKGRHLNPADARVCGQCGSTCLTDATSSLSLGRAGRWLLLIGLGCGLVWLVPGLLGVNGWSFRSLTGYRSPAVWLIETTARLLWPLLVLYFVSAFIPGEAGRQFRSLLTGFCQSAFKLLFQGLNRLLVGLSKLLLGRLNGSGNRHQT